MITYTPYHHSRSVFNTKVAQTKIFEEYSVLKNLDFSNVLIAGGIFSFIRNNYRIGNSDLDLFIYGLDEEGSKQKLREIFEHVRQQTLHEKLQVYVSKLSFTMIINGCVKIQIILRRYRDIAHILNSFDLGSSAMGFDGENIWMSALGQFAWQYNVNIINPRRFCPNYVPRLIKYLKRDFAIALCDIDRKKIINAVTIANFKITVKCNKLDLDYISHVNLLQANNAQITHEYDIENAVEFCIDPIKYYLKTGKEFPLLKVNVDYDKLFEQLTLDPDEVRNYYRNNINGVGNFRDFGNYSKVPSEMLMKQLFPGIKPNMFLVGYFSLDTNKERENYINEMIEKEIERLTLIFKMKLPKPEFVYLESNVSITNAPKTVEELYGDLAKLN